MKLQVRLTVLLLNATTGAGFLVLCAGCEDAAARQRETVQAQIKQANLKFQQALTGGASDSTAQALNGVVAELGQIQGGEPGQQAAKSVLAATALREIAGLRLSAAADLESAHRLKRSFVRGQLNSVQRLLESAKAIESVDAAGERQQLRSELESARSQVTQLREKIDQLDAPITEQATINTTSKKEVDALRLKVNELRRRAQELGHADGFADFQVAVETSRQADKIEFDISQREIRLDYELTPELTLTDSYAQRLDAMIKAVEEALVQLDAFAKATAEQSASHQKQVADLSAFINSTLNEIEASRTNDLVPIYEDAQATLEMAASQAQSAVGQVQAEDAQAARLTAVQVHELLGRLHWSRARGLADHQEFLQHVASAKIGGGAANLGDLIKSVSEARTAAIDQAKSAYTAAQELLTQVQSRTNPAGIEAFSRSIQNALASISGQPIQDAPPTETSTTSDGSTAALASLEFSTADELRAYLANMPKTVDAARASLSLMHASTPMGQRVLKASNDMMSAFGAIDAAMRAKFNQGLLDAAGPLGGMAGGPLPGLSDATVTEETEDRVVLSTNVMGQTTTTVLRKINGRWMIDLDELDEQTAASMPMLEQMASSMQQASSEIISRIESGELKSAQEVMVAFGQVMMGGMGGGMGGMGGPPARPR